MEYHHIIPFHQVKSHNVKEMVVLCPEHHHRADCAEIPKDVLYQAKQNPFNENKESISKDFFLLDYPSLQIKAGSNIYLRTPVLLEVDGQPLITIREEGNKALLNAKFFNRHNKLLAEIKDNEWIAYKNKELWDIQYSPGHLKINREKGNILMDFQINGDVIMLRAKMFFNGYKIDLQPNKTVFGENNTISNSTISDCGKGIVISTRATRH
ncbi:HNH endonuclease signature motif containing protein [Virgibacillus ainsalahensis]